MRTWGTLWKLLVVAALAAVLLAGCDDGDDTTDAATGTGDATATTAGDDTTTTAADDGTTTTADGGGGDQELTAPEIEGEVNERGTVALEGDRIEVQQGNFFFDPTFIQAEPGTTVTVALRNPSSVPHTFTIDQLGVDEVVSPGGSATVEVELPSEPTTVFICRFHEAQGMRGAFFSE